MSKQTESEEAIKKSKRFLGLNNFRLRLFINFFYAAYHFFVVEYILGYRLGIVAVIVIFGLGMALDIVKDQVGLVAAIVFHMGADYGVVIALIDLMSKSL